MLRFSTRLRLSVKINDEYRDYKELPAALMSQQGPVGPSRPKENRKMITAGGKRNISSGIKLITTVYNGQLLSTRTPLALLLPLIKRPRLNPLRLLRQLSFHRH